MAETRALLLIDLVDSTGLAQTLDEPGLAAWWQAHDRLARDLLPTWRGQEIDKTDGFLLLFGDVADAAGYALAYHAALATLARPLPARAGLHVGPVILRENAARDVALGAKPVEVEGLAKPLAARVMALARGGQTLLSAAAAAALGGGAWRLRSHGHWSIKGLEEPVEIFEIGDESTLFAPPEDHPKAYRVARQGAHWRPVRQVENNLPQPLSSFVGRGRELAELRPRLEQGRMLTLFGIGGIGKTRLALELARNAMGDFGDGVWLVELAPLADPDLVPRTVARALGLKEQGGQPVEHTLVEHLRGRHVLLLLDNCEHLLQASARLADLLLRECAGLQILASSREALGVDGEQVVQVSSLPLPDPKQARTPDAVQGFASVQLFVERARFVRADFQVTPQNAPALASVCCRLDGIPLAIELAAARTRSLTVEEIHRKLDQRFRLLTGGSRAALPRQQTLRSLIDWSYDLLREPEKRLLLRLSVFAGGWTPKAAERVCAGDDLEATELADLLGSLCDKSLVAVDLGGVAARYGQLETVRQYARERLLEQGGGDAVRDRHADHFLALAEEAEPKLLGPEQAAWLSQLEGEHDNLRAALEWSLERRGADGLRLCRALQRLWITHGHLSEGLEWCRRALDSPGAGEPSLLRAKVLNAAGTLALHQSDYAAARGLCELSLALQRTLGDRSGMASSLNNLGAIATDQGDLGGARGRFEQCLAIVRELGDRGRIAGALQNLAAVTHLQGDRSAARPLYAEALALMRERGDRRGTSRTLVNLGTLAAELGDRVTARAAVEESAAIAHELGDAWGRAAALNILGDIALDDGDLASAQALQREGLALRRGLGDRRGIGSSLEGLAAVAAVSGHALHAARLWGAAEAIREAIGAPLEARQREDYEKAVAAARARVPDPTAFDRAWQAGRALPPDAAAETALG